MLDYIIIEFVFLLLIILINAIILFYELFNLNKNSLILKIY